ncbi:CPBP family intramembrane glutamic endopeptidase [Serinibacter arcticus]|uniref:CAAX prenyl protease 2/Lysostaphin resistance protein A-like domain-containing protein n=1 Tax=Serinibacter arcticus TaxID=1655435 RepID=A0A4Z1E5H5_9MICO|nr:CPBP family intramembrane glutamic endopeptidase [Serinibacter arcticus]TGO04871.1 hypothetical protein SERN_2464 [Serinibacter arcticus]
MTYILGRHDPVFRLRPTLASGIVTVLATGALVVGLQFASGTPYRAWASSDRILVLTEVVPVAVATVFLVTFLRWSQWDAIWRDTYRLPTSILTRAIVLLAVAGVLARTAGATWGAVPARTLVILVLSAVLTGLVEELALRGVLLRALRVGRRPEVACALWVVLASALVQLPILWLGSRAVSGADVVVALVLGALLYLVRRTTRTLVVAIGVHVAWDLGSLLERADGVAWLTGGTALIAVVASAAVALALLATVRRDRLRRALIDPALS